MAQDSIASKVVELLTIIEKRAYRAGYEKGLTDSEARVIAAIRNADSDAVESEQAPPRHRAPKGLVGEMVQRVMTEQDNAGVTADQILDGAKTDLERMVKKSSVRGELRAGRHKGLYTLSNGRWFLAERKPPAPASTGTGGELPRSLIGKTPASQAVDPGPNPGGGT